MVFRILYLVGVVTCVLKPPVDPQHQVDPLGQNLALCDKFGREPYFEQEMVLGKPWRIYYTWNMKLGTKCLDMTFKNVSSWTVNRFFADMSAYLDQQPAWDAAMLLVTMGPANHQMLLFADQGPAGRVLGLPNVIRDNNILTQQYGVPLMKFQLKMIRHGKFLIMMDCTMGVVSLSAQTGAEPPFRAEIESAASELGLGGGFPACTKHKHPHEMIGEE